MLLKEIQTIFHKELAALYPKAEVDSFFYLFMEHYLGLERFALVLQPNFVISREEEDPFFKGLARLKKEEPIQYILGETQFMDIILKVDEMVLIPRPETEELVQWIISEMATQKADTRILDIGTGSGCIAIALAKALPRAEVVGLDVSNEALKVAKENAELNRVEVEFLKADILNTNLNLNPEFDLIVSNPPYVRELEKEQMRNNVKEYEPEIALFVPDDDALRFYEAIVGFSKRHLKSGGKLFLEINQYLAKETQQLLVDNDFGEVELRNDIFGNFRMLKGTWPEN
jgi:release factor glutamine methyltransferase